MLTKPRRALLICQWLNYLIAVPTVVLCGLASWHQIETWHTRQARVFESVIDMSKEFGDPDFMRQYLISMISTAAATLIIALLVLLSAFFMGKLKQRWLSLVVAGLSVLAPILAFASLFGGGMGLLGLGTIWVLTRPEVKQLYAIPSD